MKTRFIQHTCTTVLIRPLFCFVLSFLASGNFLPEGRSLSCLAGLIRRMAGFPSGRNQSDVKMDLGKCSAATWLPRTHPRRMTAHLTQTPCGSCGNDPSSLRHLVKSYARPGVVIRAQRLRRRKPRDRWAFITRPIKDGAPGESLCDAM